MLKVLLLIWLTLGVVVATPESNATTTKRSIIAERKSSIATSPYFFLEIPGRSEEVKLPLEFAIIDNDHGDGDSDGGDSDGSDDDGGDDENNKNNDNESKENDRLHCNDDDDDDDAADDDNDQEAVEKIQRGEIAHNDDNRGGNEGDEPETDDEGEEDEEDGEDKIKFHKLSSIVTHRKNRDKHQKYSSSQESFGGLFEKIVNEETGSNFVLVPRAIVEAIPEENLIALGDYVSNESDIESDRANRVIVRHRRRRITPSNKRRRRVNTRKNVRVYLLDGKRRRGSGNNRNQNKNVKYKSPAVPLRKSYNQSSSTVHERAVRIALGMRCDYSLMILLGSLMIWCRAEPLPEAGKDNVLSLFRQRISNRFLGTATKRPRYDDEVVEHRKSADGDAETGNDEHSGFVGTNRPDSTKGRLFSKKFLNFKNLFGNKNQPQTPIIIITGGGNENNQPEPTSPTVTTTSTGSVPSATGTITTEADDANPTGPDDGGPDDGGAADGGAADGGAADGGAEGAPTNRASNDDDGNDDDDESDDINNDDDNTDFDEDTTAMETAALHSGLAQEYGIPIERINANRAKQFNTSLKRKKAGRGQTIVVRIPLKYKDLFQGGQKVILTGTGGKGGGGKKKGGNKKRGNKNKKRNNKNKNKNKNKKNKKNNSKRIRYIEV